ncbi:hypothetical protein [Stenotrophomonas sp.]|uniref:hypothetical protein n=2 Tax=Stenotrophomonas sp. TaxID=69392 RepID=UPI0028B19432|nr:hypothetical protein [Stenotrophomonas sp.]
MMEWIDALEHDAWNDVIEELVWHLRNGRMPILISHQPTPERRVEFHFKDLPAVVLPLSQQSCWNEAVSIIERFPQLNATRLRSGA